MAWGGNMIILNKGNYKINSELRDWMKHRLSSTSSLLDRKEVTLHHIMELLKGNEEDDKPDTKGWPRINIKLFKPVFDRVLREVPETDLDNEGRSIFVFL